MQTSPAGRKLIEKFEGLRLKAYRDSVGVLTIGVGHTSKAGPPKVTAGMKITAEEADQILASDLAKFEKAVSDSVKVPLTQNQFDALVSLCFNIGPGNFGRSTLLKVLNLGKYEAAASQFLKWVRAGGRVLLGLVRRRKEEAALFLTK